MIVITKQLETFLRHRRYALVTASLDDAALREIECGAGFRRTLYVCQCEVDESGPPGWRTHELDPLPQTRHWGHHRHFSVSVHPDDVGTFMEVMESAEIENCG